MTDFPEGFESIGDFTPQASDSLARLLEKAEGFLAYLRMNEEWLRGIPASSVDERRALWEPLAALLREAVADPAAHEEDARLEANRVSAEESRLSAIITVTSCVHLTEMGSDWIDDGEEELWVSLTKQFEGA